MWGSNNTMKKSFKMSNDQATALVGALSVFRTANNSIRFSIGVKDLGDSLGCFAVIVNGGCMERVGFSVAKPKEFDIPANGAWTEFILSASDFCSKMSILLNYNADIAFSYDETVVEVSVGQNAKVPMKSIDAEHAEPLLNMDFNNAIAMVKADKSFLSTLTKGGYWAKSEDDPRGVLDRVALKFADDTCTVFSTDQYGIAKACSSVKIEVNEVVRATDYLKNFKGTLDAEELAEFQKKVSALEEAKDNDGIIALAKENDYSSECPIVVGLPANAYNLLTKIYKGAADFSIAITPNNLHVISTSTNILSTFALAGSVASIYERTIDKWNTDMWSVKAVVDKDAFLTSMSMLKLGSDTVPFKLTFDKRGMVLSKEGSIMHVALVSSEEDPMNVSVSLDVAHVMNSVSKLDAGNIAVYLVENNPMLPVAFSNDVDSIDAFAYVMPRKSADEKAEDNQGQDDSSSNEAEATADEEV